jgi:uncharacterized protein (TIGR00725 family)
VGVVGAGDADARLAAEAAAVGAELARRGAVVVCGGLGGVMEAACRGAKEAGGSTLGVLPGSDRSAANDWVDMALATGLGEARNALVVRACDALIALGLKAGKPVFGIDSWDIPGVVGVASPEEAAAAALETVS